MLGKKLLLVATGLMGTIINASQESPDISQHAGRPPVALRRVPNTPPPTRPVPPLPSSQSAANIKPESPRTENQAVSAPDLDDLLDPKTEGFFKGITSDEYNALKAIKCVSNSIRIKPSEFKPKNTILSKTKNMIFKEGTTAYKNYNDYKMDFGEYYEILMETYLIDAFRTINENGYTKKVAPLVGEQRQKQATTVASPFAQELEGLIRNAFKFAEKIAPKIPGFKASTSEAEALDNTSVVMFITTLPSERLETFTQCLTPLEFKKTQLKKFKDKIILSIQMVKETNNIINQQMLDNPKTLELIRRIDPGLIQKTQEKLAAKQHERELEEKRLATVKKLRATQKSLK